MRKIFSFLVLLLLFCSVNAQITSYPYSEDFESGDGGWVVDGSDGGSWALGLPSASVINSADSGSNAWVTNLSGDYSANESGNVISPVFDLSSLNAPSIEFGIWWESEFSWDGMVLQSSIDGGTSWENVGANGDPNNWFNDGTISGNPGGQQEGWTGRGTSGSGGWVIARHALTGLAGESNVIFRFAFGSDGSVQDEGVAFDTVSIFDVNCPEPFGITVSGITSTTAVISWTAGGSEMDWEVAVQPVGTGIPTGNGTATNNNPYTATGLTPSTAYEVYVRANCDTQGFSSWTGPVNFTTSNVPPPPPLGVTCTSGTSSFLFTENFDDNPPTGWTGTGFDGSNGNWDIAAAGANSFGTGPGVSFDGGTGTHLEYEASGDATAIASAISPAIDLSSALDGAELSFFFHAFGADMGTLAVGVSTSATGPFTNLFTWVGDFQMMEDDAWVPVGLNLDAYLGQTIYLEFSYGGAGTGFEGDMAIDFIRVESCGDFCIAPSSITATNITGTSADISWTGNNGETSWEYVVVPAGSGEPTGSGIQTSTPSASITGLEFSTDYEIWVRADCGSGSFSAWSGPSNFTTTIQINFTVDCAVGPTNSFICYGNNDSDIFTYTSSDGSPLNLTINAGEIEGAPFDFLLVTDGDGTVLYNDEGNDGDLTGLTFQSITDTITFQILSDGSVSCESSTGALSNGIDITVACATCVNPVASYQVIDDCDNGDQFLIDVNITDLGDATSLTITNNIDASTIAATAVGTYQIGPFPFLVDVIVTVSNDQDVNCVINSSPIQLLACPPENDNPCDATVAVVNNDQSCDLLTSGTLIEATDSGVPSGTCDGNPDDDVWFQFTALSEVQLISIINISGGGFNTDHALYEGTCDGLVQLECTNGTASVTPQLVVGNTYYVRVFSGGSNSETTTFDLCIKEAPINIICENAENFCAEEGGALTTANIVGILDPTDIACLGSAPNPTWNIIQIGDPGLIEIEIAQEDENGNGLDVDFVIWGPFDGLEGACDGLEIGCPDPNNCPSNTTSPDFYPFGNIVDCSFSAAPVENLTIDNALSGEVYILLVTNFSGQSGTISISQTNDGGTDADGNITAEIEVDLGDDQNFCGFPDYQLNADSPFADTYEWYNDGFIIDGETGANLTVSVSGTYTVIAYDEQCDAQAQDSVTVVFGQEPVANLVDAIETCDDSSADNIEDFDLEVQTAGILGTQLAEDFNVTYHLTLAEAQADTGALVSPYTNVSNPQTIFARIEDANAEFCFATTSFDLIISGPTPTASSVPLEVCDDDADGNGDFDLAAHSVNILDGQSAVDFTVTYYQTEFDAETAVNPLDDLFTGPSQTIFARVESNVASQCYTVVPIDLIVAVLPVTSFTADFDYEVCPDATVPIIIEATPENFDLSEVSIRWFRDGQPEPIAGANGLTLSVLEGDIYSIEVTFNDTGCSSIKSQEVIQLESCVIPQGISPNGDGLNDTFDLSNFRVTKLEIYNRYGLLVYQKTSYVDEWVGQTDQGDELPVGTYFYSVSFEDKESETGWVYIQRQQ